MPIITLTMDDSCVQNSCMCTLHFLQFLSYQLSPSSQLILCVAVQAAMIRFGSNDDIAISSSAQCSCHRRQAEHAGTAAGGRKSRPALAFGCGLDAPVAVQIAPGLLHPLDQNVRVRQVRNRSLATPPPPPPVTSQPSQQYSILDKPSDQLPEVQRTHDEQAMSWRAIHSGEAHPFGAAPVRRVRQCAPQVTGRHSRGSRNRPKVRRLAATKALDASHTPRDSALRLLHHATMTIYGINTIFFSVASFSRELGLSDLAQSARTQSGHSSTHLTAVAAPR